MIYKIDTSLFLARCSALFGYKNDWLAQCRDNVTEGPGFPVGQHYKVAMSAHCHTLVRNRASGLLTWGTFQVNGAMTTKITHSLHITVYDM